MDRTVHIGVIAQKIWTVRSIFELYKVSICRLFYNSNMDRAIPKLAVLEFKYDHTLNIGAVA